MVIAIRYGKILDWNYEAGPRQLELRQHRAHPREDQAFNAPDLPGSAQSSNRAPIGKDTHVQVSIRRALCTAGLSIALTSGVAWSAEPTAESPGVTPAKTATNPHRKQNEPGDGTKADNTGVNKRDRSDKEVTADQQKNNKSDVQLTAEIRRAIMKDKSLSMNAHNVKIIVQNGSVTLKGPVASQAEKTTVEQKATDVLGASNGKITSEIAVAP
jgi:hyperosmotically inducible periplasmic protein